MLQKTSDNADNFHMYNLDEIVLHRNPPTFKSQIPLHLFCSFILISVTFLADGEWSLKFGLLFFCMILINAELFFIRWVLHRPFFLKLRNQRVQNTAYKLEQAILHSKGIPVKVLKAHQLWLHREHRIAIDTSGKRYNIFYAGPVKAEFQADLYKLSGKFSPFEQRIIVIPKILNNSSKCA